MAAVRTSSSRRPMLWFTVFTAVIVLAAVLTSFLLAAHIARDRAVGLAAGRAAGLAEALPRIVYADLLGTDAEPGLDELDRMVRRLIREGQVLRVKVWSADGTVLYSDERRLVGKHYALDGTAAGLLPGGEPHAEVTALKADENVYDSRLSEKASTVIEVYVSIESADRVPLLFEAYLPVRDLAETQRTFFLQILPIVVGVPLLVAALLFPSALAMARSIRSAERERLRLVGRLVETATQERRRVSRELHDVVIPDLSAVQLTLEREACLAGDDGELSRDAVMRTSSARIRSQIEQLRIVLSDLHSPSLARLPLAEALTELAAPLSARGIDVQWDVRGDDLGDERARLIYDLVREGLRNVSRHAPTASRVLVRVRDEEGELLAEVMDDGQGLGAAGGMVQTGHGLGLIADSVAEMGGELTLGRAPGGGAVLTLRVPRAGRGGPATSFLGSVRARVRWRAQSSGGPGVRRGGKGEQRVSTGARVGYR